MKQGYTPETFQPRQTYDHGRVRVHPISRMRGQQEESFNEPTPDKHAAIRDSLEVGKVRLRPQPWSQQDDEEALKGCIPSYRITATINDGAGQTVYLKEGANPACYYGNINEGDLNFISGNNPPACSGGVSVAAVQGTYTSGKSFTAWWNYAVVCGPPGFDSSELSVVNNGTCTIEVNGTPVLPGATEIIAPLAQAPGAGDQSAFGGGTSVVVTVL